MTDLAGRPEATERTGLAGPPADGERRLFVGVGNESYQHLEVLDYPVRDVAALVEILGGQRFVCVPFNDLPRAEIETGVEDTLSIDGLRPGGVLVAYWGGHGEVSDDHSLRLPARDDRRESPRAFSIPDLANYAVRTGASQVLLILDTCFSGAGLLDAAQVAQAVFDQRTDDGARWFGVVATSRANERAADGAFGQVLADVLRKGPSDQSLKIRWNAYQAGVRGDDVIEAVRAAWDRDDDGQSLQALSTLGAKPIFRNPFFDAEAPDHVVEHLLWSARGGDRGEAGNWFSGRGHEVGEIVSWIRSGQPGLFAVTGAAGTGKSAVVGRIVSLSSTSEREEINGATGLPASNLDPGAQSVDAHLQLRGATLDSVARSLFSSLGIDRETERPTHHHVLAWAAGSRSRGRVPTLVFDGLDEASEHAHPIASELLAPLGEYAQVLVATRRGPENADGRDLIESLTGATVLDLGADEAALYEAIGAYVVARLSTSQHEPLTAEMDPQLVAEQVVATVGGHDGSGEDGPFLLARLVTSQLREQPVNTADELWTARLSASVEEALLRDLAKGRSLLIDGVPDPEAARVLLTALAFSYGSGVPADDVWPAIATSLADGTRIYGRDAAYWALREHGRYVTASGLNGQAVYRLHQRLAETLIREHGSEGEARLAAGRAALDVYQQYLEAGNGASSQPYLWLNAWKHARDGGLEGVRHLGELARLDAALVPDVPLALDDLSERMADAGDHRGAVAASERVVALYELLTANAPAFVADLANSLTTLSSRLGQVGEHRAALPPAQRAVELYEQMVEENPAYLADLASGLVNLGIRLSETGDRLGALSPAQRAVELYEKLADENPAYLPNLALSLGSLGNRLGETGDRHGALPHTRRSVELYERLVDENPAYLANLALSLGNLGVSVSETGDRHGAIPYAERAVELYEQLAAKDPNYLPSLAGYLGNYAVSLNEIGDRHASLPYTRRAIELYEALAEDNPAYLPNLAGNLGNLGVGLGQTGDTAGALAPARRAVELFEALAAENPAYLPNLAANLGNLGIALSHTGDREAALTLTRRAVELDEKLADENPAYLPSLASNLGNLGNRLSETGHSDQALAPTQRAADIYEQLATINRAFEPDFARSLGNLAANLNQVGDPNAALEHLSRAVALYEEITKENRAHLPNLGATLGNLGVTLSRIGKHDSAIPHTRRALELFEQLANETPAYLPDLAGKVGNLAHQLSLTGKGDAALPYASRAVKLYEQLAAADPSYLSNLAGALGSLADTLSRIQGPGAALPHALRAADVCEQLASSDEPARLGNLAAALDNLSRLGEFDEAEARWERLLRRIPADQPAGAALRLTRWRPAAQFARSVEDCYEVSALADTANPRIIGALRERIRALYAIDPRTFESAWSGFGGSIERWMSVDQSSIEATKEWIAQPTWAGSKEWLLEYGDLLGADVIDVALLEIQLDERFAEDAAIHRNILQRTKAEGIDGTYDEFLPFDAVAEWLAIKEVRASADYLETHVAELLKPACLGSQPVQSSAFHQSALVVAERFGGDFVSRLLRNPLKFPQALADARRLETAKVMSSLAMLNAAIDDSARVRAQFWLHAGLAGVIAVASEARSSDVDLAVAARGYAEANGAAHEAGVVLADASNHRPTLAPQFAEFLNLVLAAIDDERRTARGD